MFGHRANPARSRRCVTASLTSATCRQARGGRRRAWSAGSRSWGSRLLLDDRDVERWVVFERAREPPPRSGNELLELLARYEEIVEPWCRDVSVADPDADLTAHPTPLAVPLVIREMLRARSVVRIEALAHDPAALGGDPVQAAEQAARLRPRCEQAEVVAVHHDGVEDSERLVDVLDAEATRIVDPAPPTNLDRPGRGVDCDDIVSFLVEVERESAGARGAARVAAAKATSRTVRGMPGARTGSP